MKKKLLIAIIIMLGIAAAIIYFNYYHNRSIGFMCSGNYTARKLNDDGAIMELNVKMTTILSDDGNGVLIQQGEMLHGKDIYIIDREIRMFYNKLVDNGYHAVQIKKMVKRKADNTPSVLSRSFPILGEMQNTMYVNITSINGQVYLFNELESPYFLCDKS